MPTAGLGLTPAVHTTVRAEIRSPPESVASLLGDLFDRGLGANLDAARAQLARRELRQAPRDLLHDPVLGLHQHPAHPLRAAAGIQIDRLRGEVLQLGQPLDAGVSRADEHEPQVLGALGRILERLGDIHAAQHPVAQRGGI